MTKQIELKLFWIGVAMLVCLIALGTVVLGDSQFALPDHQAAATAARVDEIQQAWHAENYFGLHVFGMVADLAFIVVYSLGAWRAGEGLRAQSSSLTRLIGLFVMGTAIVFFVTDITETSLQLTQMVMDQGVEWMAATAAFCQPIKVAAWTSSFLAVLLGLLANRLSRGA